MATASPVDAAQTSAENFKGEVLDPSAFNKNWVIKSRIAMILGTFFYFRVSKMLSSKTIKCSKLKQEPKNQIEYGSLMLF